MAASAFGRIERRGESMKGFGTTATLSLLLALASGQAVAAEERALPSLEPAPLPRAAGAEAERLPPPAPAHGTFRPARDIAPRATREVRERALQEWLAGQEPGVEEARTDGALKLRFHRRGNAFKDLQGGYREMCNRVSAKVWDEPNGKRVRFDVAGKPGVGVEIPLGRAKR
jgi:hypothetical protein